MAGEGRGWKGGVERRMSGRYAFRCESSGQVLSQKICYISNILLDMSCI